MLRDDRVFLPHPAVLLSFRLSNLQTKILSSSNTFIFPRILFGMPSFLVRAQDHPHVCSEDTSNVNSGLISEGHQSSSFTVFSGSKPELIDNIGTVSHQ